MPRGGATGLAGGDKQTREVVLRFGAARDDPRTVLDDLVNGLSDELN